MSDVQEKTAALVITLANTTQQLTSMLTALIDRMDHLERRVSRLQEAERGRRYAADDAAQRIGGVA